MRRGTAVCMALILVWCSGGCGLTPVVPEPKPIANRVDGSEMIYVSAGAFKMGSDDGSSNERPAHDVYVEAFYISKYEITNKQFKRFVSANSHWRKSKRRELRHSSYLRHWVLVFDSYPWYTADHPVVYVSWSAAKAHCEWVGGRLPTEAEWEYACRAGSTGKYCFGDDESELKDYAWYWENSGRGTHPVGQKKANAWGIHDMHGNVAEWTSSIYKDYPYKANDGREDPNDTGSPRVFRGGGWPLDGRPCGSSRRAHGGYAPTGCGFYMGFRVCLSTRAPK